MRRVFGNYDIPTHFKPTNTLQQLLVKPKDPASKENVVGPVHKIKWEECDGVFVGETERSLKVRFSEHRRPSSTTWEVSKHIHVDHPQHSMELENTEVFTTEPRWFERGAKEAISIRALNPNLNRDGGRYNLPPVWDIINKKVKKADRPIFFGGGARGGSSLPSRTASQTTSPERLNWWSWQTSAKALVSWTLLSWVLNVQGTVCNHMVKSFLWSKYLKRLHNQVVIW